MQLPRCLLQLQGGRILLTVHHQSTMPFVHNSMYLDLLHPIKEISNMCVYVKGQDSYMLYMWIPHTSMHCV